MFSTRKRDTYAIWFKHLPHQLVDRLELLEPDQRVNLLINGEVTVWARMKRSASAPTPGLRIEAGRPLWTRIPMGESFTIEWIRHRINTSIQSGNQAVLGGHALTRVMKSLKGARDGGVGAMFDGYEFADFSGAKDKALQRRAIRMAYARGRRKPEFIGRSLTRETLQEETLRRLEEATHRGVRLAFGRDHQYSIPWHLAEEIGLGTRPWRGALRALVNGSYGGPALAHASEFAAVFNAWLKESGRPAYFFSRTKSERYRIPRDNPRPERDPTTFRLTEMCPGPRRCVPKLLNRIGDNGTVGGQTVVGLMLLEELLSETIKRGIPLAVWPFDGLDIRSSAYDGRHVMFEPYPSSIRDPTLRQNDWNDAFASVRWVQQTDRSGRLARLLDLAMLTAHQQRQVLFEGWMVGHEPPSLPLPHEANSAEEPRLLAPGRSEESARRRAVALASSIQKLV